MAQFDYDSSLPTVKDQVRFFIGDKIQDAGPRPGDKNFIDDEIAAVIAIEGSLEASVAAMFETLAAEWIRYPSFQADNFSLSRSHIAKNFQDQAKMWRDRSLGGKYGNPVSRPITRVDAYSDDLDSVTE